MRANNYRYVRNLCTVRPYRGLYAAWSSKHNDWVRDDFGHILVGKTEEELDRIFMDQCEPEIAKYR